MPGSAGRSPERIAPAQGHHQAIAGTPGQPRSPPIRHLRIRRLGVRVPPSALKKSRWECCWSVPLGVWESVLHPGEIQSSAEALLSGSHGRSGAQVRGGQRDSTVALPQVTEPADPPMTSGTIGLEMRQRPACSRTSTGYELGESPGGASGRQDAVRPPALRHPLHWPTHLGAKSCATSTPSPRGSGCLRPVRPRRRDAPVDPLQPRHPDYAARSRRSHRPRAVRRLSISDAARFMVADIAVGGTLRLCPSQP